MNLDLSLKITIFYDNRILPEGSTLGRKDFSGAKMASVQNNFYAIEVNSGPFQVLV